MLCIFIFIVQSYGVFERQNDVCDRQNVLRIVGNISTFMHHERLCDDAFRLPEFGFIFARRYFQTHFETDVSAVFHQALSSIEYGSGLVLDIGANTGWFSALAAHCYGARVHAFEPQIECMVGACAVLRRNPIDKKVDWHVNFVATQHFEKEIPDYFSTGGDDAAVSLFSCDPGFSSRQTKPWNGQMMKVESVIIDELFKTERFSVVKIDTEGHEIEVIGGMRNAFKEKRVGDAVMEISPKWWPSALSPVAFGRDCQTFIEVIYNNGYGVSVLGSRHVITKEGFEIWADRYLKVGGGENIHIYKIQQ